MMFLTAATVLFTAVLAVPNGYPPPPSPAPLCAPGLFSNAQCCATDVLGVADLDCGVPSSVPQNPADFQKICAKAGQRPRCCAIPVLGQAVLCETPLGAQ